MSSCSKSIILFGDASLDTRASLSEILLARKEHSLLSLYFDRVSAALQDEYVRLPAVDRKGIPELLDLNRLTREPNSHGQPHPAVHAALLVLVQLACFIASYEMRPQEPYPTASYSIIIGLCLGELSATAVSLAQSLTELLPIAVEAVRLAFRVGLAAATVSDELEPSKSSRQTWSVVIPRDSGLEEEDTLKTICQQNGIVERNRVYLSARSRNSITISGPPSTLTSLIRHLDRDSELRSRVSRNLIQICAPYHASHLYSEESISKILESPTPLNGVFHRDEWAIQPRTLLSGFNGKYYVASNRRGLIESVLYDILARPMNWDQVLDGCAFFAASSEVCNWIVRPFGPTSAAQSLTSNLRAEGQGKVILDEYFGSSAAQSAVASKAPLAIVGMAGRFPGADSHDALWKILEKGLDCHKVIPADRFDAKTHSPKAPYGCFLDAPGNFDTRFFNMSPREAKQTEPGQRLALVTAYEALEMSGFVPNRTSSTQLSRVGTFYGQTTDEYKEQSMAQEVDTYFITGSLRAFGPGRINYHFKFGGPATSIDTVCSSSSVALNIACNSIWSKECDTAVAGGMNILCSSDNFVGLSAGHFLSETGGCKTFDDGADGYCRGEAVCSVVIKRLDAAQADNDNILGVILAAATNYSAEAVSITRPHGPTQEGLYRTVLDQAGIRPFDVDYIEMHGTGTQAGDAVEMSSVTNVFAPAAPLRPADRPLYVGAVKTNIGHGESASGVTGLMKTLLVFREQRIPPHIGIKGKLNRNFPDLERRNLYIPSKTTAFPSGQPRKKRRALINNFGAAGGNTAIVLEEPPPRDRNHDIFDSRPEHVITITAKTSKSLAMNIQRLVNYLDEKPDVSMSDLSYTTTARRSQHSLRVSVVSSTLAQARDQLTDMLANDDFKEPAKASKIAFAFTGQGSFYESMGQELFDLSSKFRSDLIRLDQIAQSHGFSSFLCSGNVMAENTFAIRPGAEISGERMRTEISTRERSPAQQQLFITAIQIALCRLWASWGINPDLVIGHSLGEYAALYVSGVLTVSDTLYLVGRRAQIMEATCTPQTHLMLAVHASLELLTKTLGAKFRNVEVACINGPKDVVLSGLIETVKEVQDDLESRGLKCTVLFVPFGFHSSQMDPILDLFEEAAQAVTFLEPKIPIVSPLLRKPIRDTNTIGPSYLRRHARETVDFCGALNQCRAERLTSADTLWLEIGPNPLCLGMIKVTLGSDIRGLPTLRKGENAWTTTCKAVSLLHTLGRDIDWKEYHRDFEHSQRLLILPSYAFDEKNYWIEYKNDWLLTKGNVSRIPEAGAAHAQVGPATTTVQRLISHKVNEGKVHVVFKTDLADPEMHAIIVGHLVNGSGLCPASVYADIALTVADYIRKEHELEVPATGMNVIDMQIQKPIIVPIPRPSTRQILHISAVADLEHGTVEINYGTDSPETQKTEAKANCLVAFGNADKWLDKWSRTAYLVQKRIEDLKSGVQQGTTLKIFRKMAYKLFKAVVDYDVKYHGMDEVLLNSEELEAMAVLKLYAGNDAGTFFCSPLWIDSLIHLAGFVMNANDAVDSQQVVYISHGWGSMQLGTPIDPKEPYQVHVKMQPLGEVMVAGDVTIFQGDRMVGLLGDLKFQQVPRSLLNHLLPPSSAPESPLRQTITKARAIPSPAKTQTYPLDKLDKYIQPAQSQISMAEKVLDIVGEEIGVPVSELSDERKFSELGVDSLLSLTILSKLRETLHIDLPQATFEEDTTVKDLMCSLEVPDDTYGDLSTINTTPASSGTMSPKLAIGTQALARKATVSILRTAIAEEIGVEVEELLTNEDLSTLGVDSLMSLSILGALREKVGLSVPPDVIEGHFSLAGIEKALNLSPSSAVQTPTISSQPSPKAILPVSVLLQGNPMSASKKLFLFPDGSGSAMSYAKMPRISSDVCVFGLNSPLLRSMRKSDCSVEDLAKMWVAEVRSKQAHGPYVLGGWSAGGYYAFEVAKQLMHIGEAVARLILIDSPCRLVYDSMPLEVLDFLSKSGVVGNYEPGDNLILPRNEHFVSTIRAIEGYSPTPVDSMQAPQTFIIWASDGITDDLDLTNTKLDLSRNITRFLLNNRTDLGPHGWENLLSPEAISIASMPGNHFSIIQHPQVEVLAELIADAVADGPAERKWDWRHL